MIKVGEEVEAKFTNVDRKTAPSRCRSRRRKFTKSRKPSVATILTPAAAPVGTTLGELLKEKCPAEVNNK